MFFERLKSEREALGLSQQALAERLGVSLRSQQNYESGSRAPDVLYLAALAELGANVLYIVTGRKTDAAGAGFGTATVEKAVKEAVDLFSLEKTVNADQLALAVVKLCRKAVPIDSEQLTSDPAVQRYEGSQQNFYGSVGGDVGGRDIVKGPRK